MATPVSPSSQAPMLDPSSSVDPKILTRRTKEDCVKILHEGTQRNWLRSHGKHEFIDFDDEERRTLKRYFNAMDSDGTGCIGVHELEEALVAFGLAETRREVQRLVSAVSDDGSGLIEFPDFLNILRDQYNDAICYVFKQMMAGRLGDRQLSFPMLASTYRRKMMMDAMMATGAQHERGKRIMNAFATQMREHQKNPPTEKTKAMQRKLQMRQGGKGMNKSSS